jgi:esterase/lipase
MNECHNHVLKKNYDMWIVTITSGFVKLKQYKYEKTMVSEKTEIVN